MLGTLACITGLLALLVLIGLILWGHRSRDERVLPLALGFIAGVLARGGAAAGQLAALAGAGQRLAAAPPREVSVHAAAGTVQASTLEIGQVVMGRALAAAPEDGSGAEKQKPVPTS